MALLVFVLIYSNQCIFRLSYSNNEHFGAKDGHKNLCDSCYAGRFCTNRWNADTWHLLGQKKDVAEVDIGKSIKMNFLRFKLVVSLER